CSRGSPCRGRTDKPGSGPRAAGAPRAFPARSWPEECAAARATECRPARRRRETHRATRSRGRRASPPGPPPRGRCAGPETARDRYASLRKGEGLPGLQDRDGGGTSDTPPELLRICLDEIPGVVVHRDNVVGFHELHGSGGILNP